MKILFYLVRFPAFGGIETVTNIIGTELISSGDFSVDIITNIRGDRDMTLMHFANLFVFPDQQKWYSDTNRSYIRAILQKGEYDALIYQDSYSGMERIVVGEANNNNVPVYVFEHNSPLWFAHNDKDRSNTNLLAKLINYLVLRKRYFLNRRSKMYLLGNCKKYVLLSDRFRDDLHKVVNFERFSDKIISIPNPIIYTPIDKSKLGHKEKIILTVCQLNKTKNVTMMLQMWSSLSKELPDWKYMIVGDGAERAPLEKQVQDNFIQNVEFIGFTDPQPFYEKAKIFWMASKYEGWGMTLVEAMQKGCVPVVMNTFSSLPDIITDRSNGIIVQANDMAVFENCTKELATDEDYYKKLAQEAICSAGQYAVTTIIKKWKSLFIS